MTLRIFKNRLRRLHKSLTAWFNGAGIILLTTLVTEPTFISFLTERDLTIVLLIGNIALRFKTNSDLADK